MHRSDTSNSTRNLAPVVGEADPARRTPHYRNLNPEDQETLRGMAAQLRQRQLPSAFIEAALRSTAEVLRDLAGEPVQVDSILQREQVQSFIRDNAVSGPPAVGVYYPRRERKREERETLHASVTGMLRDARLARGRHEVKKTRNLLLKVDQRELRRVLGKEGDDLCRQINTWLRSAAPMF